ncbi:MAG: hypothetical protein ACOZNI_11080 [Myxococcota bacterium]
MIAFVASALAFDGPVWWVKTAVGGGVFPDGAISRTTAQYRAPLHRSESIVFRDTYAGAGLRAVFTPVFADGGAVFSLAPIDVFDVDLSAGAATYYSWGGNGLLAFDAPEGKLTDDRHAREGEDLSTGMLYASAAPTLKAKLGPVIAFDAWTISYVAFDRAADAPFVYEPGRDLVVAWQDVTTEHQAGLLYQILPGKDRPLLNVGATFRDRKAYGSGDRSAVVGGLVAAKPGTSTAIPTIVVQGLAYVIDADRVGREPNVQLLLSWVIEKPATPKPAEN